MAIQMQTQVRKNKKKRDDWNSPIMWVLAGIHETLVGLFGWQTWEFVSWLFPADQILARVLTMVSFDIMAQVWGIAHTFYRFHARGAKKWVIVAWIIDFILSLLASILYLVIQFFFRFNLAVDPAMVSIGYVITIVALTFNIIALLCVLILEWRATHPRFDYFDMEEDEEEERIRTAVLSQMPQPTASAPDPRLISLIAQELAQRTSVREAITGQYQIVPEPGQTRPLAPAPSSQNGNGHKGQI